MTSIIFVVIAYEFVD